MHLQPPDLLGPGLGKPGQHRAGGVGLDELLRDPQAVRRPFRVDPDQLLRRKPQLGQAHGVGRLRWRDQIDAAVLVGEKGRQRGPQQPPFAQSGLGQQQLAQSLGGPAAARQRRVQHVEAGGQRAPCRAGDFGAAPQGLRHMDRQLPAVKACGRRGWGLDGDGHG
ncbi:hypothetical protein D3C80_1608670 [compost metagenome]